VVSRVHCPVYSLLTRRLSLILQSLFVEIKPNQNSKNSSPRLKLRSVHLGTESYYLINRKVRASLLWEYRPLNPLTPVIRGVRHGKVVGRKSKKFGNFLYIHECIYAEF